MAVGDPTLSVNVWRVWTSKLLTKGAWLLTRLLHGCLLSAHLQFLKQLGVTKMYPIPGYFSVSQSGAKALLLQDSATKPSGRLMYVDISEWISNMTSSLIAFHKCCFKDR